MKTLTTRSLSWLWFLFVAPMVTPSATGLAASTAYVQTTRDLPLDQVQLVVVAQPGLHARLYDRAMSLFTQANLPLTFNGSRVPAATLILALDPHSVDETCPGKVLYAPSLALKEPVIIPRNSAVMTDSTWLFATDRQIREPVGSSQLETDLDGLVDQFIADYKVANPGWQSQQAPRHGGGPRTEPSNPVNTDAQVAQAGSGLNELAAARMSLSVMAGRATESLRTRAIRQLTEAGLPLSAERNGNAAVTLGVELIQRPLDSQCPDHVLYEQGLYLVEQVRIKRNPQISIWSDTWLREAVHIVPPVPIHRLESDQDALLQQLIHAFQTK